MKELSAEEFSRLTAEEKCVYLAELLGVESDSAENDSVSDSNDEDWFPVKDNQVGSSKISDNEDLAINFKGGIKVEDGIKVEAGSEEEDDGRAYDESDGGTELRPNDRPSLWTERFVAEDDTVCNPTLSVQREHAVQNIIPQESGLQENTENLSIVATFKAVFTIEMVDVILRHTNRKAARVYETYNKANPTKKQLVWVDLTYQEFYAFLGILIISGVNNSNLDHTTDMWKSSAYPLYRATMGINRFLNILRFIQFDDPSIRNTRIEEDKVAAIKDIWMMLNSNLAKLYKPTERLTIDEQLFPYRGRTKFTRYIPSKPAKYGIKVWWICDSKNSYPLQGQIDTETTGSNRQVNQDERVIKDLVASYVRSGRNICIDNYFMSKGGVNAMDQMLTRYTTKRATKKWPLAFFYNIVDIAALAAYLLYCENNTMVKKKANERRCFLRQLGEELCMSRIEDRSRNARISGNFTTKLAIESMLGRPIGSDNTPSTSSRPVQAIDNTGRKIVVGSCHMCYKGAYKKRRKTRKMCEGCKKPVCNEHTVPITKCMECVE